MPGLTPWWERDDMPLRIRWNPVTIKRWHRFRQLRRAWWSLWILAALFALSLASELVCNSTPLLVRFNDRLYFPIWQYYPEATFLPGGSQTRPDYRAIARAPAFTANPRNCMVFAPVPYGPLETTDPASLPLAEAVTLGFQADPAVATLTLGRDGTILRVAGSGTILPDTADRLAGQPLRQWFTLPASLDAALECRWRNQPAPAWTAHATTPAGGAAILSLPAFTPRATPPASLRMLARTPPGQAAAPGGTVAFDRQLGLVSSSFPPWPALDPATRSNLLDLAGAGLAGTPERRMLTISNTLYTVTATRSDVRWPFKPVPGHWLGLDSAGRDVLARLLYGLRTSLVFGFLLVALTMALGVLMGSVQGYFGKTVDIVGQRLTEIWSAIPFLYVMILLGAVYGRGFALLLLCYAAFNWVGISYYVRAEFLRLRHLPFVEAARTLGLPHRTLITRHILPNALVPLVTFFPFSLVGAIGSLAALDYLGFGLPPPTPSWGELLAQAQQFRWAWWLILYPALALFVVMLLGVFVGEGIRAAYDPRPQTRFE